MKRLVLLKICFIYCFSAASSNPDEKPPPSRGDAPKDDDMSCEEVSHEDTSWPFKHRNLFSCNTLEFTNEKNKRTFIFDQQVKPTSGTKSANFPDDALLTLWSNLAPHLSGNNVTVYMSQSCLHLFQNENVLRIQFELTSLTDEELNITHEQLLQYYKNNGSKSKEQVEMLLESPVPVTRSCPEDIACGGNSHCTTVLNQPQCRCFDHHKGNPLQKCFGFCSAKTICGFSFPETWAGMIATSNERCPSGSPKASVLCQGVTAPQGHNKFAFTTFRIVACGTSVESVISIALNSSTTPEQLEVYASYLQVLTTNSSTLSTESATSVVEFLREVSNQRFKLTTDTSYRTLMTVATQLVQGYWQANSTETRNLSLILAQSLPKLALRTNFSENQTQFGWQSSAFALQTNQINGAANDSLIYSPTIRGSRNGNSSFKPISLQVPISAVEKAREQQTSLRTETNGLRTAFLYYRTDDLFESETTVSNVLSVDLGDNLTLDDLDEPVTISHLNVNAKYGKSPLKGVQLLVNKTFIECVFWDFSTNAWSSKGCCLNITSDHPECQCSHLTNFALIVRSEDVPANFELQVVSLVGCILSIVGLLITIAVMAVKKELRKYRSSKMLLNICCNLFIVYIIFVSGASNAIGNAIGCIVVTALLHYFFLTTWCWMTVYSFEMYSSLVKIFDKHRSGFLVRCYLFSYVLPAVVVIITASASLGSSKEESSNENLCGSVTDTLATSPYHADNVCWLKGYPLYFGFLLPAGLLLTYNLATFALVTYELNRQSSASDQLKRATKDSLLIATTMTFIIGLAWIFGYILLISVDMTFYTVMSWLFAVFNTLQGFGIFLLTSLRREDMRNVWWGPIKRFFTRKSNQNSPISRSATRLASNQKHTGSHFIMSETR